jgi:hypothetical protein
VIVSVECVTLHHPVFLSIDDVQLVNVQKAQGGEVDFLSWIDVVEQGGFEAFLPQFVEVFLGSPIDL